MLGVLEALFQFTFDGHPTVDRYCGYIVKLDPQDGKLLTFRSGPRPPPIGSAGTPISEASARARASLSLDGARPRPEMGRLTSPVIDWDSPKSIPACVPGCDRLSGRSRLRSTGSQPVSRTDRQSGRMRLRRRLHVVPGASPATLGALCARSSADPLKKTLRHSYPMGQVAGRNRRDAEATLGPVFF